MVIHTLREVHFSGHPPSCRFSQCTLHPVFIPMLKRKPKTTHFKTDVSCSLIKYKNVTVFILLLFYICTAPFPSAVHRCLQYKRPSGSQFIFASCNYTHTGHYEVQISSNAVSSTQQAQCRHIFISPQSD